MSTVDFPQTRPMLVGRYILTFPGWFVMISNFQKCATPRRYSLVLAIPTQQSEDIFF